MNYHKTGITRHKAVNIKIKNTISVRKISLYIAPTLTHALIRACRLFTYKPTPFVICIMQMSVGVSFVCCYQAVFLVQYKIKILCAAEINYCCSARLAAIYNLCRQTFAVVFRFEANLVLLLSFYVNSLRESRKNIFYCGLHIFPIQFNLIFCRNRAADNPCLGN